MSEVASDWTSELGCDFLDPSSQLIRELHESQTGSARRGFKTRQRITLCTSPGYLSDWDGKSAFRELYQNWKDAIMETHRLRRKDFRPIFRDEGRYITILVPRPSSHEQSCGALGFIKYQKSNGNITLANSNSSLPIEALGLGWSSKNGPDLIGCHGEGLKLAAMVLIREGCQVRIAASRTNWTFSWNQKEAQMCCVLRPSVQKEAPSGADAASDMMYLRSRISRDVSVTVTSSRCHLPAETFLDWLSVTMDIHGLNYPVTVAATDYGDVILDMELNGSLFFKGLLVSSVASQAKGYKLSYNFAQGALTRDRLWVADQQSEADLVRKIWESALARHSKELLPIYVSLLRYFPDSADVALADRLLESSTKNLIWQQLRQTSQDREFFYDGRLSSHIAGIIREHTGKQPVALPPILWEMLRSCTPIRTFDEEQTKRFKQARLADYPKNENASKSVDIGSNRNRYSSY